MGPPPFVGPASPPPSPPPFVPPIPPPMPPPRPYPSGFALGSRSSPAAIVGLVAFLVIFFVFVIIMFGSTATLGTGASFSFFPFCGLFVFVIILFVVLAVAGLSGTRSTIPPPPPIQQPMVPAGMQGPVALNCPNCGAPPQGVDRFGVATCSYCNTRYLVR